MRKLTLTAIIAGTAVAGIAAGATVATVATPEPGTRTVNTVERADTCAADYADMLLANVDMLLTSWEAGTAYDESIRTDNLGAYELLLSQCD